LIERRTSEEVKESGREMGEEWEKEIEYLYV
jgi:hypothetical protein